MTTTSATTNDLKNFYQQVRQDSYLLSTDLARRWTKGVLKTVGQQLDRGTKKAMAKALPQELAEALTSVFWLVHFRDSSLSSFDFQKQVASRSGHSDAQYARQPIIAVFRAVKKLIDADLRQRVAKSLSPEIRELWQQA
jgi:uncharacterized protein (DUF2267 family)